VYSYVLTWLLKFIILDIPGIILYAAAAKAPSVKIFVAFENNWFATIRINKPNTANTSKNLDGIPCVIWRLAR